MSIWYRLLVLVCLLRYIRWLSGQSRGYGANTYTYCSLLSFYLPNISVMYISVRLHFRTWNTKQDFWTGFISTKRNQFRHLPKNWDLYYACVCVCVSVCVHVLCMCVEYMKYRYWILDATGSISYSLWALNTVVSMNSNNGNAIL